MTAKTRSLILPDGLVLLLVAGLVYLEARR
jgi:hypothetical protein